MTYPRPDQNFLNQYYVDVEGPDGQTRQQFTLPAARAHRQTYDRPGLLGHLVRGARDVVPPAPWDPDSPRPELAQPPQRSTVDKILDYGSMPARMVAGVFTPPAPPERPVTGSLPPTERSAAEDVEYDRALGRFALDTGLNMIGAGRLPGASPAGAVGAGGGAPQLGSTVRNALPMDEASRLARATQQGYTIDAYKGWQPHDWNTLPVRSGSGRIIEGADRVPTLLPEVNSPNAPYAGFFTNNPDVATRFAQYEGGGILPAKLKFDNPLVIDAKGEHAAAFQFPSIARERGTTDQMEAFKNAFSEGSKHDGVILKNTKDEGDVYVPRNSNQVRSRFATFDPANANSGMLLGAGSNDARSVALAAAANAARDPQLGSTVRNAAPIRAYHSSPHDFDRFDFSKIGTGEGAQVYGHGGYFAENPKVSGQGGQYWNQFKSRFYYNPAETEAISVLQNHNFDRDKAIAELVDAKRYDAGYIGGATNSFDRAKREAIVAKNNEALALLQSGKIIGPRTYEVNIHARPEQMLDWDKPLSTQQQVLDALSGSRRKAVKEVMERQDYLAPTRNVYGTDIGPVTGKDFYKTLSLDLSGRTSDPKASEAIRAAGIPGIRYLDEGSRGTTPAPKHYSPQDVADYESMNNITRNYVIFDPGIIEITKKYGIPGMLGAGALGSTVAPDRYKGGT